MKKYFLSLGLIVAATFTLTNCTEQIDSPVEPVKTPFEIVASTVDTKTVNDGMATNWVAGDAINLFHQTDGDGDDYTSDGMFEITEANLEAKKFTGTITDELDPDSPYDWYAIYPYNQYINTPASTSGGYTYIGYSNGLTQNGYNSTASLKGSVCPLYGVLKNNPAATTPSFTMNHLSSVIAINVTNANNEPLTITTASFTAPEDIVGSYYIDITKTPVVYTANSVKETATVNVTGGTELAKGESAILYAAIKPFTATTGQTLTLSVNGYSKDLVLTKDVTFSAGKIKTLNFSYDKPTAVAKTWSLVSNVGDIVDGEYVILATKDMESYGYLPSTTTSSNPLYGTQTVLNPNVSVASAKVDSEMIWNVVSNNDGTITLTNDKGKYFYGTNAAQGLKVGDTEDTWEIAAHPSEGANGFYMKSKTSNRYVGVYNTDWRSYSSAGDGNYDVTIEETTYDGLKSQLYFFYCGTISAKTQLAIPANVVAVVQNTNEISVSWDSVTNADVYAVTCGDETVNVTTTSHTFTDLNYSSVYTVSVIAKSSDKTRYYDSEPGVSNEVTTGIPTGIATYEWTLAKGDLGENGAPQVSVTKGTPSMEWTVDYSWPSEATKSLGWDNNYGRGVQIGTGSDTNKCNSVSLTATGFGEVNSITIGAGTASKGNAKLSVTVGGSELKCGNESSVTLNSTTTPTTYKFTAETSLTGDIVITITNNASKALYIASVSINK